MGSLRPRELLISGPDAPQNPQMNTNRDLFDVRIDDDLFEVIVSYLPIKDKLRYESVSKRFQRFVFDKQKVLKMSYSNGFLRISGNFADSLNEDYLVSNRVMNVTNLTKLLKKFRFITCLMIDSDLNDMTEVMDTITEYCDRLTEVRISSIVSRWQTVERFYRKFGPNLKRISFFGYRSQEVVESVFKYSPNVTSISYLYVHVLKAEVWPKKSMKFIHLLVRTQEDLEPLLRPELLHLKYFSVFIESDFKPNDNTFKMFSYFKNLKVLEILLFFSEKDSIIWSKTIESIATNCLQLEYFSFIYRIYERFVAKECFQSLSYFTGLKKICFRKFGKNHSEEEFDEQITDLRPLKNCKNLMDLNLRLEAIDGIFNGIDLIIPQLRQLSFESEHKITDEVLESMANLKNLIKIVMKSDVLEITSEGLRVVTNDCKRLKSFIIYGVIRVNDNNERKNINELIETNPKIYFNFEKIEEKN